ncbi:MAG: iron-containing alcohol dehydrogenase [Desulfatibacillaceae bacterium]
MLPYYEFYCPVKIVAGNKAVDNLTYELEHLGAKKPLIITDQGVVGAGLLQMVVDSFADAEARIGSVYEDTPPDSSNQVVNAVAQIYRQNGCDSIVAVGGGSVMDTAKAVNILVTEEVDDLLTLMGAEVLKKPLKPMVAIPTTAGTGSEVTYVAVIANPERQTKMPFTSYHLFPDVAVIDPRMTLTMPPRITAATGMDALTHAVEAFTCLQKNPMSDAYAWSAIELMRDNLVTAVKRGKNEKARFGMALGSLLAGIAFSNSMVGCVHALAHAVGGICHVPHGVANAIFLPFGMEYNMARVGPLYGQLLLPLAGFDVFSSTPEDRRPVRAVQAARDLVREMNTLCGLPTNLREAGVPKGKLEDIAEAVINDGALTFNPEEMDYTDALKVLQAAYE